MRTIAAVLVPLALVIALLAIARPARAAMMAHHDLASLALEADAIVRAERTGGPDDAATYRVIRVLAGHGLRAGETITIAQSVYHVDTTGTYGRPMAGPVEPTAYLFLRARRDPSQPAWSLVGSGLRLVAGGRAYRFEQMSNPGPYVAVPQGRDPDDAAGVDTGVHWTVAELEQGIAAAMARADRARAAIAAHDRASILALLPADAAPTDPLLGFYEDRIAVRGFEALLAAGDLDGALDVLARTRGLRPWSVEVGDPELLARAESATAPLPRRIAALALLDLMPSDDTARRLLAIARDTGAPAPLRVAAIETLTRYEGVSGSDPGWPARRRMLVRELRALVRETIAGAPASVRSALVTCAARWELRGAVPGADALVASATGRGARVRYHVVAAPGITARLRSITVLRADGSACDAEPLGGSASDGEWRGALDAARCPDATLLRVEVRRGARDVVWTVPIER